MRNLWKWRNFKMQQQLLCSKTNTFLIGPTQWLIPTKPTTIAWAHSSSESDHHLSAGQYDEAEEYQKATDHDLNSDSVFVFFNLVTINDFKPFFTCPKWKPDKAGDFWWMHCSDQWKQMSKWGWVYFWHGLRRYEREELIWLFCRWCCPSCY